MKAEVIDRLKAQLLVSGIQQQNPALFQVINLLIDAARSTASDVQAATGGGGGVGVLSQTFVTSGLEQGTLANSRQIRAGAGITIMDSGVGLVIGAAPIPMDGEYEEEEAYIPLPGPQGPIGPTGPAGSGAGVAMPLPLDYEYEEIIGLPFGSLWLPPDALEVPFSAGNFTASGAMTWTVAVGDQQGYSYKIFDRSLMWLAVQIATSSIGGVASTALRVAIPDGWKVKSTFTIPGFAIADSSASTIHEVVLLNGTAGQQVVEIYRLGAAVWPLTTDTTNVYMNITFPVTR